MKEENAIIEVPKSNLTAVNPYDRMVEMALSSDVGIDKLEKLLELKERHEANEARKAYHKAMAEFKACAISVVKDKKGHNNMFASLANILDVVTPLMGNHGLTLSWNTEQDNGLVKVTAIVTHKLGYSEQTSLTSELEKSGNKSNIHGLGSAISYLERYTAKAILGIAEKDQDNDGQTQQAKINPVALSQEYRDLMETKGLFPDLYEKMLIDCGGEPMTKEDCVAANNYIKSIVDAE